MKSYLGLSTMLLALPLCACPSNNPNAAAEAVLSGYVAAAGAEAAYESLPNANPTTVAAIKVCDNAAYSEIGPINTALMANQSPAAAALASAQSALTTFQSCLTAAGVKLQ